MCACVSVSGEGSSTIAFAKLLNVVWSHFILVLMDNIDGEFFLIINHYGALKRTNEAEDLILIFVKVEECKHLKRNMFSSQQYIFFKSTQSKSTEQSDYIDSFLLSVVYSVYYCFMI